MASKKVTLKSVQEQLETLRAAVVAYTTRLRFPKSVVHSTTAVAVEKNGEVKGRAVVSIEELIATSKTASLLGKITVLQPSGDGKSLTVHFVDSPTSIEMPDSIREAYNA
jgi:hypothetical protein